MFLRTTSSAWDVIGVCAQGNPASDEAGGGLARPVPSGERGRVPAGGWAAVYLRARWAAHGHVSLQVPPHAPDPYVQGDWPIEPARVACIGPWLAIFPYLLPAGTNRQLESDNRPFDLSATSHP